MLTIPRTRGRTASSESSWPASLLKSPSVHGKMPAQPDDGIDVSTATNTASNGCQGVAVSDEDMHGNSPETGRASGQPNGVHLHTMDISHQLRSMSALSDEAGEDDSMLSPSQACNAHQQERLDVGRLSSRSRHSHKQSGAGFNDAATAPARVRSPAASSIYSRPSSRGGPEFDQKDLDAVSMPAYLIPNGLDGALSDWPLFPTAEESAAEKVVESMPQDEIAGTGHGDPNTARTEQLESPGSTSVATSGRKDSSSTPWLSPREPAGSIQSKESSSNLTVSSKRSRFFERFSPPKKAVKKRRSIFKFLRPGSRKQQVRSISSPILRTKPSQVSGLYDGPSDDPALLTVQYELAGSPQPAGRAASVNLDSTLRRDTAAHLMVPGHLQRRSTLADYERDLTAAGDDRRRPSSVDLRKLGEVQEDDRHQSLTPHRKLSRARPLSDDPERPTGLMAQALEKHQQEKAVFRSASKQRESHGASHAHLSPDFRMGTSTASGTSLPSLAPGGHIDLLDPLDRPEVKATAGRTQSVNYLIPPEASMASSLRYPSTAASFNTGFSRRASSVAVPSALPELHRPSHKIGTSLASWSRYPSHTRAERCGSAGRTDAVIARDFAFEIDSEDAQLSEEDDLEGPRATKDSKAQGKRISKRSSSMFSGLARYYSNIFGSTDTSSTRNRRTSVSKGGWLTNPDLEMLPAVPSSEPSSPYHDHHFRRHLQQLEHELEETVRRDVKYVEEEARKIEHQLRKDAEYVEEEAERLGKTLRKDVEYVEEAEKVEKQLRKDVEYMEEEAGKFMHLQPQQYHGQQKLHAGNQLFREDGLFQEDQEHRHLKRNSTYMGPLDETAEEPPASTQTAGTPERNVTLDGAGGDHSDLKAAGKAEIWSELYKECLIRPDSADSQDAAVETPMLHDNTSGHKAMAPPTLKPIKGRSPEQLKRLDPTTSIRRFPSVTVVDDRKGHSRSVSLISIKLGADGVFRSSTNDLLELIQAREQEEREKLLKGADQGSSNVVGGQA